MTSILIAIAVLVLTFAAGLLGLYLQTLLPAHHTSDRSRDMIGAVVGLVTLLLALVLGTLIGSAYAFYATQKSEVETLAARVLQSDLALAQYGPETALLRAGMKAATTRAYQLFWQDGGADPKRLTVASMLPELRGMNGALATLSPTTEAQKQILATVGANAGLIEQMRLLMSLQLASPVSWPLLEIVVSWSLFLFCGFGVLSRINATTVVALGVGAFGVASAIFLVLELSQPYTSLFRIPPAALEQTIAALGG